jgi:hypothetical protein
MFLAMVMWRRSDRGGGDRSPFVLKSWHRRDAAAALTRAAEQADCAVDELTPTRYADIRLRHPELELPKHAAVARAFGGWHTALEQASGALD